MNTGPSTFTLINMAALEQATELATAYSMGHDSAPILRELITKLENLGCVVNNREEVDSAVRSSTEEYANTLRNRSAGPRTFTGIMSMLLLNVSFHITTP